MRDYVAFIMRFVTYIIRHALLCLHTCLNQSNIIVPDPTTTDHMTLIKLESIN